MKSFLNNKFNARIFNSFNSLNSFNNFNSFLFKQSKFYFSGGHGHGHEQEAHNESGNEPLYDRTNYNKGLTEEDRKSSTAHSGEKYNKQFKYILSIYTEFHSMIFIMKLVLATGFQTQESTEKMFIMML